jgi:hypothetical protein
MGQVDGNVKGSKLFLLSFIYVFIYDSLNDSVSCSECRTLNDKMISE